MTDQDTTTESEKPTPPNGWANIGDVYSNFDHQLEEEMVERLESENVTAHHPAWDHHGTIWHEDGTWYHSVWRHRVHVETMTGDALEGLIDEVNDAYGHR